MVDREWGDDTHDVNASVLTVVNLVVSHDRITVRSDLYTSQRVTCRIYTVKITVCSDLYTSQRVT